MLVAGIPTGKIHQLRGLFMNHNKTSSRDRWIIQPVTFKFMKLVSNQHNFRNNWEDEKHLWKFGWSKADPIQKRHVLNNNLNCVISANFGIDVVSQLPKNLETGIYYGWASVDNDAVHKMVMSVGWNPYYKNEHKSMVRNSFGTMCGSDWSHQLMGAVCHLLEFELLQCLWEPARPRLPLVLKTTPTNFECVAQTRNSQKLRLSAMKHSTNNPLRIFATDDDAFEGQGNEFSSTYLCRKRTFSTISVAISTEVYLKFALSDTSGPSRTSIGK